MSTVFGFVNGLIPVSLTDQAPFESGAYIIQYGNSGEYTSFPIISSASSLLIAYTSTCHMCVFHHDRTAIQLVDANHHVKVVTKQHYGVKAIYRLQLPPL